MANKKKGLFHRLTRLFKSGPVVKRKIRTIDTSIAVPDKTKSSGTLLFQRSAAPTYATITSNAYNLSERLMRYQDFQEMEYTPEIASALDIYADEVCAQDERGRVMHINSNNPKIKELLEELFYNTLNVEFNLRSWARNLCKYGDFFLYNDVSPEYGVINVLPIPVNEIEREENFDREDPFAIRFRWVSLANRILENWEVTHFRALGNDMFLPYGASIIEPARRIWRQLILIEDAMLVYRIVRAPERRVFYIDVANIAPDNVPAYIEEQKRQLRSQQVVDSATGRVDLRYNPLSVEEDYFIGVRGGESGTKIDTLAGGQNTAAIEDVAYIQKKLFAAIKIPRAYLGYDELLSSKATLAQEDIRFSRTINVLQKTILSELNKVAIIHLYVNGYDGDELLDFTLNLSNPSTVAMQQKLELWRTRLETAAAMPDGLGSKNFIRHDIWGLSPEQCELIDKQRFVDQLYDAKIESATAPGGEGGAGLEDLGLGGEEAGGGEEPAAEEPAAEPETAGVFPPERRQDVELLTMADDEGLKHVDDSEKLLRANPRAKAQHDIKYDRDREQRRRADGQASRAAHMPDFKKMTSAASLRDNDPDGRESLRSLISNPFGESRVAEPVLSLSPDLRASLKRMHVKLNLDSHLQNNVIVEQDERDNVIIEIEAEDIAKEEALRTGDDTLLVEGLLHEHVSEDDDDE